jgi:hypothetical protein
LGPIEALLSALTHSERRETSPGYDRAGAASEHEAEEMLALAVELYDLIRKWFEKNHPDLIGDR